MVVGESRTELLQWINTILDLNYTKIEQCGTGAAFCQLMDSIVGGVPLNKVKFNASTEYAYRHNWKILQSEFTKHRITKNIDVERLIKCRLQDNLELLQWFKRYWNENADINNQYDALGKRNGAANGNTNNNSPYNTVNSVPCNANSSNRNSTLRQQHSQQKLAPPAASITRKRQSSQSPRLGGVVNRSTNNGYASDRSMQASDRFNSDPVNQGDGRHSSSTSSPPLPPQHQDILSCNYTSSNMSTRVRPRKSGTPTTSSRISTPIQRTTRKTSDGSVRRMPSQPGMSTGGGAGDTSSSFQTTTSATINAYAPNGHPPQMQSSSSNKSNINDNGNGSGNVGDSYHITSEEVEEILQRNDELEAHLNEYKLNCDTLQVERNFYFNKCRDIEILIQNIESNETLVSELDVLTLLKKIEDTLYATQEGFSSEVHNVDGDVGMLDNEF
ncbi:BIM1 [Candida metapsilosis]|uniref:BIM1 n=1 Tax=Candida metapsilosis TaxID=273372 RepID=A0A8H7ZBX1_9ASCO|nr:BIM1 [Candida metapsilosis]